MSIGLRASSALVLASCLSGTAAAHVPEPSAQQTPATQSSTREQVMLVYDSQRITDAERAQLIAYVSETVPVGRWHELKVPAQTTVTNLIDDYYDLFATAGKAYRQPISTRLLEIELRRANPTLGEVVPAGTPVLMPPVPVRARGKFQRAKDAPEVLRIFDAAAHAYGKATTTRRDELPVVADVLVNKADQMSAQRDASTTGILLELDHVLAARPVALPASVVVVSARSSSNAETAPTTGAIIDLLARQGDSCDDAFAAWDHSPYRPRREHTIAGLSPTRLQQIQERASRRRLVILDTQVGLEHGHGFKVASVARQTLEHLGVPDVASAMDMFDLLPSTPDAAARLSEALKEYRKIKPENAPEDDFKKSERWIETNASSANGNWPARFDMPDVLLQAVLHKLLVTSADDSDPARPRRTWVNMSFRIDSPALRTILKQFDPTKGLGFVAAGNEVGGIRSGYTPHDGASATSSFVLVTHGTASGPTGSIGPEPNRVGPMVSVVATGCGFAGFSEAGSSFAAPHVAASAWLQSLLIEDEQKADDLPGIVDGLRVSSRPAPGFERTLSHGLFDAQQVLADPTSPHVVLSDNRVESLRSFKLDVRCRQAAEGEEESYRSTTRPDALLRTFSVARGANANEWLLLVRTVGMSRPVQSCGVERLTFEAVTESGPLGPLDLDAFTATVVAFTGRVP